jgi:cytosine/adenosine deaminase-related metal-dependent hydrolase
MMRESQRTLGRAFDLVLDELKPGAGADLTILRYDEPTPLSAGNFAGHLYFGLDAWAVAGTVVRGRFVLRDGQVVTCDEAAAMELTRAGAAKLYRKMEALS